MPDSTQHVKSDIPNGHSADADNKPTTQKLKLSIDTHGKDDNVDSGMTIDIAEDCERSMMSQTLKQMKTNEEQQETSDSLQHLTIHITSVSRPFLSFTRLSWSSPEGVQGHLHRLKK